MKYRTLVPDEATIALWARNIKASTADGEFVPSRDMLVLDFHGKTVVHTIDAMPSPVNVLRMIPDILASIK